MVKCSVITTVWNVEEWLDRNIQSFLAQTLTESELILVNDCSPDNSKDIIAKYNNDRIKVINNETNLGAGVSRQIGVNNSSGEYTIFVDGDDWLENDCLEVMYKEAIAQNADIVSCSTIQHNDYGMLKDKDKDYVFIKKDIANFINNKLIKRDIWSKTHYSPLRFKEDINTLDRCLEFANKMVTLEYAGYHYNLRPNSLTSAPNIACKGCIYNILAIIENIEFIKTNNIEPSHRYKYVYNIRNVLIGVAYVHKYFKDEIPKYQEELDTIKQYIINNSPFKKHNNG